MKYSKIQYLHTNWFEGSDENVACKSTKLVMKTRKVHACTFGIMDNNEHNIPIGSEALYEKGILWEKWGSFYICVPCMEKHLDEYCGFGPEQEATNETFQRMK